MTPPGLLPLVYDSSCPKVSVVMPTYNRADFLSQSASMILNQTLSDLELIICDDCSTDNTEEIVVKLCQLDTRVRYHRLGKNQGITQAVNEAISISRGDYIQICHDHDFYFPELIEKSAGVLDRNSSVVFVHAGRQGCDYLGNPLSRAYSVCGYPEVSKGLTWKKIMLSRLSSPVIGISMIRRVALEQIGLFDPEFGACSDIDMWMRLCEMGDVGYVNELLIFLRGRDPTHPYAGINWEILDQVIRTHRKHLRVFYTGEEYIYWKIWREFTIDLTLLIDYLNSFRHHWWEDVRRGRSYLRRKGGPISRTVAYII
jgi:glycosyltransferase involved in cell wall biosynthesis